jgi:DegV family protein with EDD domain
MRIVMDDAGDVPDELIAQYNIKVVPVNVTFGSKEYLTGVSMDHQGFYDKVREVGNENFPKTSQPTPFQFAEVYRGILGEGEREILTITVGQKLSGTYASAEMAGRELAQEGKFYLFDSAGGSAAQGYMVIEAARMVEDGEDIEVIMTRLEKMRRTQQVVFLIDSLEYAVKGGRVRSLQSVMASLLRIKPIMKLENGEIVEAGKVRTYSKALDYIVEFVGQAIGHQPVKLAIIHAGSPDGARILMEKASQTLDVSEQWIADMGVSVAINLGPGALGIVAVPE